MCSVQSVCSVLILLLVMCACRLKNRSLQEELEAVRVRASGTQLELREKLAQTVTEITLLHHTLRGVTNELHAALNDEVTGLAAHNQTILKESSLLEPNKDYVMKHEDYLY